MKTLSLCLVLLLLAGSAYAYNSMTYTANNTYTVPAGVTSVVVEAWGAGGGSGGTGNNANAGGGGGGGGAYSRSVLNVTPGQNYTVTVGSGGVAAATAGNAGTGGDSWFGTNNTLLAKGGAGGLGTGGGLRTGGTGGQASSGVGTTKFSGGTGGTGGTGTTSAGSGGGGAGTGGDGGSGGTNVSNSSWGGTGGASGGGTGGNGSWISAGAAAGGSSTSPGGGAGGSFTTAVGSAQTGVAGADGLVRVTEGGGVLSIYIYDELNSTLVTGVNISITATSDNYTTIYSTVTGISSVVLPEGSYTVSLSGGAYAQRQYVVTIANSTEQTLNAYMLVSSSTTLIVVRAIDGPQVGQSLVGATVTWETFINGSFRLVESRYTDISGTAGPFAYCATCVYRVTVSMNGYTTKQFTLNPVLFSSYDVGLSSVAAGSSTNNQDLNGVTLTISPTRFYNNANNSLSIILSDPTGGLASYSVTVSFPGGSNTTSGTNAIGETFLYTLNITGATFGSTVNVSVNYTKSNGAFKSYTYKYLITGSVPGAGTWASNLESNSDYGLGVLEKALIAAGLTVLVAAAGFFYGGSVTGGALALLMVGFFAYIGFWSWYAIAASLLVGFAVTSWGGNRI